MRFRLIDGLTVRFAESEDRADHVLLLGPWPESLLAFEPIWARLPHSRLDIVDAGHFVWEDAANEYAALIVGWWDGGAHDGRRRMVLTGEGGDRGPG